MGDEKCIQNFSKNLKGQDYLGNLGINWKKVLKWIFEDIGYGERK